jgi:hypothetical protein
MPSRSDISDYVIHFTKSTEEADALTILLTIVGEGRLAGSNGKIKGGYQCVCFTEAPLPAVAGGLVNANSFSRYSPFGLMFRKSWVYERGARPVIYQPDQEYSSLPEELRWRHVRYEPNGTPPIDFTWEREWRLHSDELLFSPSDAVLVVPNHEQESFVFEIWDSQQQLEAETYSTILDQLTLEQMHEPCPWRIACLAP